MAEPTAERLTRLLSLMTYLRDNPGAPVPSVAAHFGTTEAQVLADVNLLWVTGTPGYLPDDLIDFSADALDHGEIVLTQARGMDRPLRLSTSEAMSLLVGLRALAELVPDGLGAAQTALASATEKLLAAAGRAADEAAPVEVTGGAPAPAGTAETLRDALARGRRVRLRYVSAADVVTERDVDPVELRTDGASWSLRAWCHRAGASRTFRLDRILDARILDDAAAPHPEMTAEIPAWDVGGREVVLHLPSQARWVAEHTPVEEVTDLDDGTLRVRLRAVDPAWTANLLLSLGESVLAVEPADVAGEVAGRARAALDAYERLSSAP